MRAWIILLTFFGLLTLESNAEELDGSRAIEPAEIDVWTTLIRPRYFQQEEIQEGQAVIKLTVPYRAEDASIVPVSIDAQIPQTEDYFIETLYVLVDNNPAPLAGTFHLGSDIGEADLAMRIRIDQYTTVRAVAKMNTGELHMDSSFVRASGGCSLPPPFLELQAAKEHIGEMNFRTVVSKEDDSKLGQLRIRHPNVNGLQLDQRTRSIIPADYMTKIVLSFNDTHIMTAETDISISQDPSFRFFFDPKEKGELKAVMEDSKGRQFVQVFKIAP